MHALGDFERKRLNLSVSCSLCEYRKLYRFIWEKHRSQRFHHDF
ncbi:hypothetical protein CEXT_337941, partial [Caerostris extrusa]